MAGHKKENGKGKEKVKEASVLEIIVARYNDEPVDSSTHAESSTAQTRRNIGKDEEHLETSGTTRESPQENGHDKDGKGKKKVNESNAGQIIKVRDNDKGEKHHETPGTTRESPPEKVHDQDNAKGEEKVNEAHVEQIITARDKGEVQAERQEQELIFNNARSPVEVFEQKCSIHKVRSGLRHASSAEHYQPVELSVGPYHNGNDVLQDMEKHKVLYMQVLLDRKEEKSMDKYIEALGREIGASQARNCYVWEFQMDEASFGKCMVLDGLFMIELFRRKMNPKGYDMRRDELFNLAFHGPRLARDMLLFENQIPLFVLRALVSLTEPTTEGNFVPLMLGYFKFNGKPIPYHEGLTTLLDDIPHLLGLVYQALVSCKNEFSVPETAVQLNTRWKSLKSIIWTGLVRLIEKALLLKTAQQPSTERRSCEFIRTAVALDQVGVTFLEAQEDEAAFYDIRFSHGVLSIPRLVVDDNTKSFFRNLVAYEQYSEKNRLHRIVDYMHVMDCLINTGKDVELLRHCGIIDNRIGDDENVSAMFNYLCSNVSFDQDQFFYSKMFKDVNEFCKDRRNVWMAKLKNEYFGSPWSVISFLAAVLLLLLATLQTGYTVASYYK